MHLLHSRPKRHGDGIADALQGILLADRVAVPGQHQPHIHIQPLQRLGQGTRHIRQAAHFDKRRRFRCEE